jgi:hypothetical protein
LEDDLGIEFTMALFNANEDRIPELITDKRTAVYAWTGRGGCVLMAVRGARSGKILLID